MTGTAWLTAALATLLVITLGLLRYGLTGTPTQRTNSHTKPSTTSGWQTWRWPLSILAGATAWTVTGWPVTAPAAALLVWAAPGLLAADGGAKASIDRADAVGGWTRRLSDVLLLGTGLEQALVGSTRTAPTAIAPQVQALAGRLQAHWPVETALRAMADEIDDPSADTALAALVLAAHRRGPGLAKALAGLADATAAEVATRRRIDADRARPRATARAVTVITVGVVVVALVNTDYFAPYGTALGQLLFAGVVAGFAACLWWMHALTRPVARARQLTSRDPEQTPIGVGR